MIDDAAIERRYAAVKPVLYERGRRRFAAAEAMTAGWGGIAALSRITGIARSTIGRGLAELRGTVPPEAAPGRVRRKGAGRPALVDSDPTLLADLVALVEPSTRGDPTAPLRWTAKSLRRLSAELGERGHRILAECGRRPAAPARLQPAGQPQDQGRGDHPDRDAQFHYINDQVQAALVAGWRSPSAAFIRLAMIRVMLRHVTKVNFLSLNYNFLHP